MINRFITDPVIIRYITGSLLGSGLGHFLALATEKDIPKNRKVIRRTLFSTGGQVGGGVGSLLTTSRGRKFLLYVPRKISDKLAVQRLLKDFYRKYESGDMR